MGILSDRSKKFTNTKSKVETYEWCMSACKLLWKSRKYSAQGLACFIAGTFRFNFTLVHKDRET